MRFSSRDLSTISRAKKVHRRHALREGGEVVSDRFFDKILVVSLFELRVFAVIENLRLLSRLMKNLLFEITIFIFSLRQNWLKSALVLRLKF